MINIQDIIPLLKDGWVAMDKNGSWWWFPIKPSIYKREWLFRGETEEDGVCLSSVFDIAPTDDWTKSLIKVGGK